MGSCTLDIFRVLFCGEEFNWGYRFTKEALQDDADIEVSCPFYMHRVAAGDKLMETCLKCLNNLDASGQVSCCRREEVGEHIGSTDLAVPLMARLDAQMLDSAPRLKAILQYGVGVEGVDIPAVNSTPTHINLCASASDNLLYASCHPVYKHPSGIRLLAFSRVLGPPGRFALGVRSRWCAWTGNREGHLGVKHPEQGDRKRAVMRRDGDISQSGMPSVCQRMRRVH